MSGKTFADERRQPPTLRVKSSVRDHKTGPPRGDAPLIDQTCDLRPATGLLLFDLDRIDLRPRRGRRRRIARRDLVQDITPRYHLAERGVAAVQGGLRRVVDEPLAAARVRLARLRHA